MNSSRSFIVQYSDSDEEQDSCIENTKIVDSEGTMVEALPDERIQDSKFNLKRKNAESRSETSKNRCKKKPLKLPEAINSMFNDTAAHAEKTSDFGGRQRTFAHVDGDWPSFVYVPVPCKSELREFFQYLVNKASKSFPQLHAMDLSQLHITLSRTVSLRHYWIDPIVKHLKVSFSCFQSFRCQLDIPELYTNDDKTRSFIGLRIILGEDKLKCLTKKIDHVFSEFGLDGYYENPSFHVSLAWHLGDITEITPKLFLEDIEESMDSWFAANKDCRTLNIDRMILKTGNKMIVLS